MFSGLSRLEALKLGFGVYYLDLLKDADEVLAVGAACAVIDTDFAPPTIWPRLIELSQFPAVKTRAFDFFMDLPDYAQADAVRARPLKPAGDLAQRGMDAKFEQDHAALARIEVDRFLQTGHRDHLSAAVEAAESGGGWRASLPILEQLVLINPQEGRWPFQLCVTLHQANQFEPLAAFCDRAESVEIFPTVTTLFRAVLDAEQGRRAAGMKKLTALGAGKLPKAVEAYLCRTMAVLLEAEGRFEEAAKYLVRQNRLNRGEAFNPQGFTAQVSRNEALRFEPLPADERTNHFIMLGFPRSGTTLLENVLASHPQVETFEEIPASSRINRHVAELPAGTTALTQQQALALRGVYYAEMDHWKKQPTAAAFVDKLPILSAQASILTRLFPGKRYIFSIRHPFDVVLSSYKQNFSPNVAMDNFTTFEDSCRIYDFVMRKWFGVFNLDSEQVCYVRYDALVEDFQVEVTRALDFLGVGWDESVLSFSERADERKVRTPSYAKVRSGISIGVQSSWRKYEFLYRKPEARLLKPWLELFGYEGL
jgi:hypothetical protein